MQTLDLNKMGLAPMEQNELLNIEGGGVAKWCWEVLKTWGAEKVLDATYEYLKKNAPANPYSGVPNSVKGCLPAGVRM
jgi:hypothetical protein